MFTSDAILSGLMKAFAFLARPKPEPKAKFTYRTAGTAVHARRRLRPSENVAVNALVSDLAILDPNNSDHDAKIKETINAQAAGEVRPDQARDPHRSLQAIPVRLHEAPRSLSTTRTEKL